MVVEPGTNYTAADLFPYSWDGPANPGSLQECALCGVAVVDTDKHVTWHNSQRSDLPSPRRCDSAEWCSKPKGHPGPHTLV